MIDIIRSGLLCIGVLLYAVTANAEPKDSKRYVVIVANNNSLDDGVAPLLYADDDGARYFELFSASGADTTLLTVPDSNTQTKFPRATESAAPPTHQKLTERLTAVFSKITADNADGIETHFTFVYAGHGDMGPNKEGYINLLDERLTRKAFFAEIVAASPATFNHIILDACHSYFLVNKRGAGNAHRVGDYRRDIRDFLAAEQLSHYPNTGVILAASQDSETHEWHRLESGIFSHELISALLGTADVNEDGIITYSEAAACVEAANFAIPIQKARLNVYFRPPAGRETLPLMDLSTFHDIATLHLEKELGGRYFVEDARGIRTADLNFTTEQAVHLKLVGKEPFYLRTNNTEARIIVQNGEAPSKSLVFNGLQENHRGSIDQSFRKHLFEIPFGQSFYLGMFAASRAGESPRVSAPTKSKLPVAADKPRFKRDAGKILGWTFLGTGVAAGIASGALYAATKSPYADYESATEPEDAKAKREITEERMRLSRAFMGAGIGLAAAGAGMLILRAVQNKPAKKTAAARRRKLLPNLTVEAGQGTIGVSGEF